MMAPKGIQVSWLGVVVQMGFGFEIPFTKFHGIGNDFIVVFAAELGVGRPNPRSRAERLLPSLTRSICDRHTGIGADGLLVMLAPRLATNDARIRIFNANGSEAEMSGNGIRCAAAYLVRNAGQHLAFVSPAEAINRARRLQVLRIETAAGVKSLTTLKAANGTWTFRVAMGTPIL
jgi:diaminopimelate epimerase